MGLFDKKYCSICGGKIGLLGNRKLEDGNMCKDCAARLSPWFSDRRGSTVAEINAQLAYREENKDAVAAFHTTRSVGRYTKLLLDEDARKFMVTAASNLSEANPDVLDYSQVTGCSVDVDENRSELKTKDADGKSVSYSPPRYEYSYNIHVTIHVNHPYFDQIRYSVSNGYVKTGERQPAPAVPGWKINRPGIDLRLKPFYEYQAIAAEIKEIVDRMRLDAREEIAAQNTPRPAVVCEHCGATTVPDGNGCCEYCGSALNA